MGRISQETLEGHLTELVEDWRATKAGEKPSQDNNIWWLNQTAYLGERFGIALIEDLLEARAKLATAMQELQELRGHPGSTTAERPKRLRRTAKRAAERANGIFVERGSPEAEILQRAGVGFNAG